LFLLKIIFSFSKWIVFINEFINHLRLSILVSRIRAYFLAVVVLCNLWGLVFACCLCVQVVYIAELNQSVSAFSSYRCSWLHLLRPLLINSVGRGFAFLIPKSISGGARDPKMRGAALSWCLHLCHMITWFFNKLYDEVIYLDLGDEVAPC
jgi:hypothetical protein